jgi:hypothetical protein
MGKGGRGVAAVMERRCKGTKWESEVAWAEEWEWGTDGVQGRMVLDGVGQRLPRWAALMGRGGIAVSWACRSRMAAQCSGVNLDWDFGSSPMDCMSGPGGSRVDT